MSEEHHDEYEKADVSSEHLALWRKVETTPTSQVKSGQIGAHKCKSVKPHFQRMKATEIFGPYGKGWGVYPESEKFERHVIGDTHLMNYKAVLWYILDDAKCEFPIYATEKEAYMTKSGYMSIDVSTDKKVATNALTKGLSFLGFSADVFHGLYDDATYIDALQNKENVNSDISHKQEVSEYKKWKGKSIAEVMLAENVGELEKLYFESIRKMQEKGDSKGVLELEKCKVKRFSELKDKK